MANNFINLHENKVKVGNKIVQLRKTSGKKMFFISLQPHCYEIKPDEAKGSLPWMQIKYCSLLAGRDTPTLYIHLVLELALIMHREQETEQLCRSMISAQDSLSIYLTISSIA